MDWCADSPTRTELGFGKVESLEKRRERPMPYEKQNFVACPVDWSQANFGNYFVNEPPSISIIPNHLPGGLLTYSRKTTKRKPENANRLLLINSHCEWKSLAEENLERRNGMPSL
ncbi:hypothetical protein AVEN_209178-1 [Araneus ventricosus]|uniref:Uncharacterized protein n=1 Tax=Araneus ventricosus TaxID=182803 RepID=A0A4Y2TMG6_ARAVE|nr:hypothetical protein AVEN_209178-1 [Araneus ventricosus]